MTSDSLWRWSMTRQKVRWSLVLTGLAVAGFAVYAAYEYAARSDIVNFWIMAAFGVAIAVAVHIWHWLAARARYLQAYAQLESNAEFIGMFTAWNERSERELADARCEIDALRKLVPPTGTLVTTDVLSLPRRTVGGPDS